MKIALIGPGIMSIPPQGWGAVEILIWDYAKELEELGHFVDIINSRNMNYVIETIKKRLLGLKNCMNESSNSSMKTYYKAEYENEILKFNELNDTHDMNVKDKIKEFCKNIKWGIKDYEYHKNTCVEFFKIKITLH